MPPGTVLNSIDNTASAGAGVYDGSNGDNAIVIDDDEEGEEEDEGEYEDEGEDEGYFAPAAAAGVTSMQSGTAPPLLSEQKISHDGGAQGDDEPNPSATTYSASISEKRMNNRVREARHAAQCILMDRELLMIHALSAHETVPQTQRRFLAQLLAPDNPSLARALCADRFTQTANSSPTAVVDVFDDSGWCQPNTSSKGPAKAKGKGKTPERDRLKQSKRSSNAS